MRLSEVCEKPQYGAIAKGSAEPVGPLFVRQTDIASGRIKWSSVPYCDLDPSEFEKYAIRPGDLLISRLGNGVGNAATVSETRSAVFAGYLVRFQARASVAVPEFLGYQLQSKAWRQHVAGFRSGAAQPTLNAQQMGDFQFTLPPLGLQRGIAATLSALDDKIESNRHIEDLVLDLAEAMYVDECAQGSELLLLKDSGRWLSGGTPSTSTTEYWGGDLPWISAASLKSFYVDASDRTLTAAGAAVATHIVPAGTVLMVVRGMSLKTEFRFGVAQRDVAFGQDCKAILPRIDSSVLAVALRANRETILGLVDEAGHGTGRLATDRLERLPIEVPTDTRFAKVADSLLARGTQAARENHHLVQFRDALLPELISGRIRVPEAHRAVEEAIA
ncbi:restriction endonuclease subunit S [Nonomuraea sp. PA05]|uniref:restriction endonuclease subunit S n=1 Tax=Nonomuraea sp. PA05 TaxID=2604466 RepID=UPI0021CC98E8|nr:restriction endonuclease subunit S [Nonomuraea sp. PA05]